MKHENELVPFYSSFLDDFFGPKWSFREGSIKVPKMNIHEDDKELKLELKVPGMTKEDIHVSYENGYLTIAGSNEKECSCDKKYLRKEFCCSSFQRTLSIPEDHYKLNETQAEYKDGILYVCIPKQEVKKSQVKKIEIK